MGQVNRAWVPYAPYYKDELDLLSEFQFVCQAMGFVTSNIEEDELEPGKVQTYKLNVYTNDEDRFHLDWVLKKIRKKY